VLGLLNDRGTTLAILDGDVGLNKRAATALIEHRDGPDGVFGTADDDLYETIEEADAQYYVGDAALEQLLNYALAQGWVPGLEDVVGSWEGVTFTAKQVEQVIGLVNAAPLEEFDVDVALDKRAAEGLVAGRPFGDIGTISEVPYVGQSALERLRAYAALSARGQVGEPCETHADCADDLRCAGSLAWGSGIQCVDTWGVFSWDGPEAIPDDGSELSTQVDVQGLASVPLDVVLTVDISHPRPADLELRIDNFNGYGTTLWSGGDADPKLEMVVFAFPSDDEVHGLYSVHVRATVRGEAGTLNGWDLLVISIYD
jgi:hypothetical protein